jgi:ribose transport system substrate-binding protein
LPRTRRQLAFVVNASSDFWKLAEAGGEEGAGRAAHYELQFRYPAQGTAASRTR